jgi:hypothetical protein
MINSYAQPLPPARAPSNRPYQPLTSQFRLERPHWGRSQEARRARGPGIAWVLARKDAGPRYTPYAQATAYFCTSAQSFVDYCATTAAEPGPDDIHGDPELLTRRPSEVRS